MKHILFLSASDEDHAQFVQALQAQGYQPQVETEIVASASPLLIVLDARVPYAERGTELLQAVRTDSRFADAPLLLLANNPLDLPAAVRPDLTLTPPIDGDGLVAACRALEQLAPTLAGLRGELRAAEDECARLEQIDRQKDEFISLMSHELKNPMASIKGYADLMRRRAGKTPGDPNQKGLDVISQQIGRMTALLDQLLDFSRINMNRLQLDRRRHDLARLVERAVELARATTDVPIRLDLEATELPADLDESRMSQVLNGLLGNAVKFSPAGGEIVVTVRRVGDEALVSVRDRGIGIPEEEQELVFEQFYRASNGQSVAGGMGLGLFVAHDVVTRHGGRIELESAHGRGTTVTVGLPLAGQ